MNLEKLVSEVVYYCRYFEIVEVYNDILVVKNLEDMDFVGNLIKRLHKEIQLKTFINFADRKRLKILLAELQNLNTKLFIDQVLEKKSEMVVN